ncbi:DUF177 domain-containing protein [bacterium]|nr:DUF177 domain-containing protein [bacterium]
MQTLKIPVEQLREGPIEIEVDMDPRELELEDEDYRFTGRVRGNLVFSIVGQDVFAAGNLSVPVEGKCVRCLEPASTEVETPVNETWIRGAGPQETPEASDIEAIVNTYVGDFIEPAGVMRELILATLPDRLYCREDCAGLCPGCGANLNNEPCRCAPEKREEISGSTANADWKQKLKGLNQK